MPYVSLAQQQQQFLGNSKQTTIKTPTTGGGGYTPLAQQQKAFLTTQPKKPSGAKIIGANKKYPKQVQLTAKPEVSQTAKFQQGIIDTINKIPKFHFADNQPMWTPNGFAVNIAQGILNTPAEAMQGTASLGTHIGNQTSKPKQVVGDLAAAAQLPLLFVGGGSAKEGIKQGYKQVIKQGAKLGAMGGFVTGLQTGKDIEDTNDYVMNLLTNTGIGTIAGGTIEPAIKALGHVVTPLAKGLSNKLGAVFIKTAGKTPAIEHIQFDPKVAQNMVMTTKALQNTEVGKAIMKEAMAAEKEGLQVLISRNKKGQYKLPTGEKVDISTIPVYEPKPVKEKTNLNIKPSKTITKEDQVIEKNFSDYLENNYKEATQRYNELPDTEGGKILNTDTVRELSDDYAQNRSKSAAVHEPASAFTKKLYEDKLKEVDPQGRNLVLFTAGGTGAGKSTAVKGVAPQLLEHAQLIYDTNMSGFKSSVDKIQKALDAKKEVVLTYVYRDPEEALVNGALPRAMRMGRTVPISEHLKTHVESTETLLKLAEHFKGNDHFDIKVIDNSHGKGKAVVADLDLLKNISYNKDELRAKLTSALEKAYEQNQIDETVYKGFKDASPEPKANSQTVRENISANDDKKLESPNNEKGRAIVEKPPKSSTGTPNPVGTGKLRESEAYKKVRNRLEESTRQDVNYNRLNLEKDAENAMKFVSDDPKRALRVAKGLEAAPEGQTETAISIALADKAGRDGNFRLQSDLEASRSLRQTRRGQEIVSERGRFNDNSPHKFIAELLDRRMKEKGAGLKNINFSDIKSVVSGSKKRTIAVIDEDAQKLSTFMKKEQTKIRLAQDIIDSLKC